MWGLYQRNNSFLDLLYFGLALNYAIHILRLTDSSITITAALSSVIGIVSVATILLYESHF